jgi:hypothetical protein
MMLRPLTVRWIALLLAAVLVALLGAPPAFAQAQAPAADQPAAAAPRGPAPVMQNVFYNVIWGSAVGALLGFAGAVESSQDKSNPAGARPAAFQGATLGGVIGLGVGIWLVYAGISFDPGGATLTRVAQRTPGGDPVAYQPRDLTPDPGAPPEPFALLALASTTPAFSLETAPGQPNKITGFRALVMDLRF